MKRLLIASLFMLASITGARTEQSLPALPLPKSLPQYDLKVRILPEAHRLEAAGTVRLPAADSVRERVQLGLSELMGDFKVEVLQPPVSAGPAALEKKERPWNASFAGPGWGTNTWTISPQRPIPAGEPVLLRVSYASAGGLSTSFGFYVGPEGSFAAGLLTAWYPEVETDVTDYRARGLRGTGTLQFTVPAGYTVYTAGTERSAPEQKRQGDFRFEVEQPTWFSFGAARYTAHHRGGPVKIAVYMLEPRPQQKVEQILEGCSKLIAALAREFGPYPYSGFAVVEVPPAQAQKAGFSGASLDSFMLGNSSYFDQEFNTWFYAHEIAHIWWGNLVQRKGPRGLYMMDEAMATYGALRAIETLEGAEAAEHFRRTGYAGWPEYCGYTYLVRAAADFDRRLDDLPANSFLGSRLANSKGMFVWDMLSREVGREKFSRALQSITRKHAFQRITWEEFLEAIEAGAGRDLGWFYAQWFERSGAPDWQLEWKQEGSVLRCAVTQSAPYFRATVEAEATGRSCQRLARTVEIHGPRTEFNWPVDFTVKSVTLDPHFLALHWTPEYRVEAEALLPYTRGELKLSEGQNEEAYKQFEAALARAPEKDLFGLRFLLEYGLGQALTELNRIDEAKTHLQAALSSHTRRADTLPWVYVQLAKVAKKLNDEALLKWAADAAIAADSAAGGRTGAVEEIRSILNPNKK
jgi:tetratricopeptide (TPR) repeat protein